MWPAGAKKPVQAMKVNSSEFNEEFKKVNSSEFGIYGRRAGGHCLSEYDLQLSSRITTI